MVQPTATPTPVITPTATPTPTATFLPPPIRVFKIEPNPADPGTTVTIFVDVERGVKCEITGIGTLDSCNTSIVLPIELADANKAFTLSATDNLGQTSTKVETLRLRPSPTPTPVVSLLGGLDLEGVYCPYLGGRAEKAQPGESPNAYSWRCRTNKGYLAIDFQKACQMQYPQAQALAISGDANDVYSWKCFGSIPATPSPNP